MNLYRKFLVSIAFVEMSLLDAYIPSSYPLHLLQNGERSMDGGQVEEDDGDPR